MEIASQILKKIITVTFDSSLLLFPLSCLLLHFQQEEKEANTEDVLYKES